MESSVADERRRDLVSGATELPRVGRVAAGSGPSEPFVLLDQRGDDVPAVRAWVCELVVADQSVRTVRAYCYAVLTWYRVLWFVGVEWQRATELETVAMVGWLRIARNPQRHRRATPPPAGSVNIKTGKPVVGAGYQASTITRVGGGARVLCLPRALESRAGGQPRCRVRRSGDGR